MIPASYLRIVRDEQPAHEPRRSQAMPTDEEWVARFIAQLERDRERATLVIAYLVLWLVCSNAIWVVLWMVRKGWID